MSNQFVGARRPVYGLFELSAISNNAFKMESLGGNIEIESVKHIEISRPIIMVYMNARRDEFSIVC